MVHCKFLSLGYVMHCIAFYCVNKVFGKFFFLIFRDFNFLGEDKLIFTMDITSLYTVIPNGEGLLGLKHFFD